MTYPKLFLEPVGFVALLWALVALWFWLRRLPGRRAVLLVLLVYWFVASPLGANLLLWPLERNYREARVCDRFRPGDPIVVLSGGKKGIQRSADEVEALHEATLRRTLEAWHLWRRAERPGPVFVTGAGPGPVKEADLMASLLRSLGVPEQQLKVERRASSTFENAVNLAPMLRQAEVPRFFLVTSALHMPRALAVFGRMGIPICPWPVDQKQFWPAPAGLWVPSIRPLEKSTLAAHEILGLVWYGLGGHP